PCTPTRSLFPDTTLFRSAPGTKSRRRSAACRGRRLSALCVSLDSLFLGLDVRAGRPRQRRPAVFYFATVWAVCQAVWAARPRPAAPAAAPKAQNFIENPNSVLKF